MVCKELGGEIVNKFSERVTHVITIGDHNQLARRTMKYLCGVLQGCWIVGYDCNSFA